MGEYLFPVEKVTSYFKSIKSKDDLQKFIQQRSAHVTQTTLYGYFKTRIGVKYTAMVEDEVFSKSINIAKWNIYMVAIADCTFYVFSYLIAEKNLKENDCKEIYLNIIEKEKANGWEHMRGRDSGGRCYHRVEHGGLTVRAGTGQRGRVKGGAAQCGPLPREGGREEEDREARRGGVIRRH